MAKKPARKREVPLYSFYHQPEPEEGSFTVPRSIFTNPMLKQSQPFTQREAIMWMIYKTSPGPCVAQGHWGPIHLDAGEFTCSLGGMATAWGWSQQAVRKFIEKLQEDKKRTEKPPVLSTRVESKQTVLRVCYEAI